MWTAVNVYFRKRCENADVRCQCQSLLSSAFPRWCLCVHTSVELCHACAYFMHNCEHLIESCNNRIYCILTFTSLKHRRKWWCASETIIMINFHHPLLSLLSFKEIDDQNLKKEVKLYKITLPEGIWLINLLMSKHPARP